ncbi:hypothetical protein [Mycobacterium tilburgii]|uniref:hypothetical protein n=1 Tax=Mycobacterium tilburgii TaxID=44467 RepID=UPI0021B44238|nr:hypothetical protein [Mycobacterium tilburgii]
MRVTAAVNTALGIHLPVRTMFYAPSVRNLCEQLGTADSGTEVVPVDVLQQGSGTLAEPANRIRGPRSATSMASVCRRRDRHLTPSTAHTWKC